MYIRTKNINSHGIICHYLDERKRDGRQVRLHHGLEGSPPHPHHEKVHQIPVDRARDESTDESTDVMPRC